ncbi:MAG: hypothetical protein QXJ58_01840 [Archaeoglobaceae archaeon]
MRYPARIKFHSNQNENQAIRKIENLTIVFMKSQIIARNGLAGI